MRRLCRQNHWLIGIKSNKQNAGIIGEKSEQNAFN